MRLKHGIPLPIRNKSSYPNIDNTFQHWKLAFVDLRGVTINPYDYIRKVPNHQSFTRTLRNIKVPISYADESDDGSDYEILQGTGKRKRKLSNISFRSNSDYYQSVYIKKTYNKLDTRRSPRKHSNHATYNLDLYDDSDDDDDYIRKVKSRHDEKRRSPMKRKIRKRKLPFDDDLTSDTDDQHEENDLVIVRKSGRNSTKMEEEVHKRMLRTLNNISYVENDAESDTKDSDYELDSDEEKKISNKDEPATLNSSDELIKYKESPTKRTEAVTSNDDDLKITDTRSARLRKKFKSVIAKIHS